MHAEKRQKLRLFSEFTCENSHHSAPLSALVQPDPWFRSSHRPLKRKNGPKTSHSTLDLVLKDVTVNDLKISKDTSRIFKCV